MSTVTDADKAIRAAVSAFGQTLIKAGDGAFQMKPLESGIQVQHQDATLSVCFKAHGVDIVAASKSEQVPVKPLCYSPAAINYAMVRWAMNVSGNSGLGALPLSDRVPA